MLYLRIWIKISTKWNYIAIHWIKYGDWCLFNLFFELGLIIRFIKFYCRLCLYFSLAKKIWETIILHIFPITKMKSPLRKDSERSNSSNIGLSCLGRWGRSKKESEDRGKTTTSSIADTKGSIPNSLHFNSKKITLREPFPSKKDSQRITLSKATCKK